MINQNQEDGQAAKHLINSNWLKQRHFPFQIFPAGYAEHYARVYEKNSNVTNFLLP
jgi:hypothetical protein